MSKSEHHIPFGETSALMASIAPDTRPGSYEVTITRANPYDIDRPAVSGPLGKLLLRGHISPTPRGVRLMISGDLAGRVGVDPAEAVSGLCALAATSTKPGEMVQVRFDEDPHRPIEPHLRRLGFRGTPAGLPRRFDRAELAMPAAILTANAAGMFNFPDELTLAGGALAAATPASTHPVLENTTYAPQRVPALV